MPQNGRFQTLFRESVKFLNFDKMFGASDSQQKTSGGFLIQQNPICNSRDIGDFLFLEYFQYCLSTIHIVYHQYMHII